MADRQLLSAVNREGSRCSANVLFPAARRGSKSVPRLSIVVPFVKNVNRLEKTLLSILENRPRDCEIILVHNGNYEDPYDLGADEVVLIETEEQSSVVGLINEGVFAACSNVISVLLPGDVVEANWERGALSMFQDQSVAAVCMPTRQRPRASDRLWARYRRIASTVAWTTTTLGRGSNSYFAWYFLPTKSPIGSRWVLRSWFDRSRRDGVRTCTSVSCSYRDDRSRSHC